MDSLFKEQDTNSLSKMRRRRKKKPSKPKFIAYEQHQTLLLPPSLEEMIPSAHIVRTVNRVIESMDITSLINTYKGGGRSSYDPMMLLKVLVYAYVMKTYSSRRIAKSLREDINYMWLSGMQKPDFRTINNFRSGRLKKAIDDVFSSMILFLSENNYINFENYFVDGTKIEANANKYSYVWASNTNRYKERTKEKIKELLKEIERVNREENESYGEKDLEELGEEAEEITSEKLEEQIKKLNNIINKIDAPSKEKAEQLPERNDKKKAPKKKTKAQKILSTLDNKYLPQLKKYEQQEKTLNGRSSYSKTDEDATFMMSKTEQLLPSYNVLMGTEHQIITNYSIHQKASEADRFIPHFEKLKKRSNDQKPKRVIGDGAYGSEENYTYLEKEGVEAYLKYMGFYQEQTGNASRYNKINFSYDKKQNKFYCPEGRGLSLEGVEQVTSDNGFQQTVYKYRGNCDGCKVKEQCTKSAFGRTILMNRNLDVFKNIAREKLNSPLGLDLRRKRATDVETVFGDIKHNQNFRRFNVRGFDEVNSEFGIVAMAHNLRKLKEMIN